MKTIGLIGGLSPESTAEYYRLMNAIVRTRLGGLHSAKLVLHSCDFGEMVTLCEGGAWDTAGAILVRAATQLERAGAECLLIGANTMHRFAPQIQAALTIPLLHIAEATGLAIKAQRLRKIGLLGTKYTMEDGFYERYLAERFGITTMVPNTEEREWVNHTIYQELCRGTITAPARAQFHRIIERLRHDGAEGIILGCTEIPLIIQPADCTIPLFDTTTLHATAAVEFALS